MPKTTKKISENKKVNHEEGFNVPVYNADGESTLNIAVPKNIFGISGKTKLASQAIRVYSDNKKQRTASTKTRGEVSGGGKKPWKEKGTGRARQGSTRAPHWRGGGIVFGPKPIKSKKGLTAKMRQKSLYFILSEKLREKKIKVVSLDNKKNYKTREMNQLFKKILPEKNDLKKLLFIYTKDNLNLKKGLKNLSYLSLIPKEIINAREIVKAKYLIFTKEAMNQYA